jgi:copper chaperone CopZ
MLKFIALSMVIVAISFAGSLSHADDASTAAPIVKATYSISGLHCPPCTRTVETSLKKVKGVRAVKVDWNTKTAKIEFDEGVLPAQQLAGAIAKTPHMMGGGMQYGGRLALKVPELKDDAAAAAVKDALAKVPGVKTVATYPKQKTVSVQFTNNGAATSGQLIAALDSAGLKSETF